MNPTDEKRAKSDSDTFDLDIEVEADTDEIMREAVQAVEAAESSRREKDEPADADAESGSVGDSDEASDTESNDAELGGDEPLAIQLKEAQERTARALADYENFRRRVDRERADYARYAAEVALAEFLPVVDNLSRALDADGEAEDLKQGVEMIQRQMIEVLGRLNVQAVASVGERFDPAVHEAVAREESDEFQQATVIEEYQTGYLLHDRLLRPAMVRVAVPNDGPSAGEDHSGGDGDASDHDGEAES